jgi:hypothetical protein
MDFEERIAYYKQAYASEEQVGKEQPRSEASAKRTSQNRRPSQNRKPKGTQQAPSSTKGPKPVAKPKSPPDVATAPQKKQGLLARLFKRNKGDA